MKRVMITLAATAAVFAAMPAQAVTIVPGSADLMFDAFNPATQGEVLAITSVPGTALTFSGLMRSAVYRNTLGTIDFYYQVARTGPGTIANNMIDAFTAANFVTFNVEGFVSAADPDGAGFFTAAMNPPSSTTTTGRSATGSTLQTNFGTNGLQGTEVSATYIFRTNATAFTQGTFGVINGSTFSGLAFAPAVSAAVPEPTTWAMMFAGFAIVGSVLRRRRATAIYAS